MINVFIEKLDEISIPYKFENNVVSITLPNSFGELEYKILSDGDDLLGLVTSPWHTHSESEGGISGLITLIHNIFLGNILLIKEFSPNKDVTLRIEENLETYVKWLPKGNSYEICNET